MAASYTPVTFIWRKVEVIDDQGVVQSTMAMVPSRPRAYVVAARQFHEGEEYPLAPLEPRSRASHGHYFAALHEAFNNIPETLEARWPTPEHFRKWLLIEANFCNEFEVTLESEREATKLARRFRSDDGFARISIHGKKIIVRTAKSQSAKAMGKQEFEESKKAVLDLASELIGTARSDLVKHAKKGLPA